MDEKALHKAVSDKYRLASAGSLIRLEGGEKNKVYKISNLDLYIKLNKLIRLFEILSTATSMTNGDLSGDWDFEYNMRNLIWCREYEPDDLI